MAEAKELDILLARKEKADALFAQHRDEIPASQIWEYLCITERIHFIEDMKFLINTAPLSMNPSKYEEHKKYAVAWIKKQCFNRNLAELYLKNEEKFTNFTPKGVDDYKKMLTNFLLIFIASWKNEKNYNN